MQAPALSRMGWACRTLKVGVELAKRLLLAVTGRQRDATVPRPSDATATNKKMGSAAFDSPYRWVQRDEPALMDGCSPARIVSLDKAELDMRLASART